MTSGIVTNASWLFPCDREVAETVTVCHGGGASNEAQNPCGGRLEPIIHGGMLVQPPQGGYRLGAERCGREDRENREKRKRRRIECKI